MGQVKRPALRYFGGKWRLASFVLRHLPLHRCYVEPFGGGASVLLRKDRSEVEVYNDVAGEVVNFFRVVRDRGPELREALALTPFAVDEYDACRELDIGDDLEIERARRFFVRSWGGRAGIVGSGRSRGWRRTPDRNVANQMTTAAEALEQVTDRLRGVAIDNLDWRDVLGTYDRKDTLFYVDPPYLAKTRTSTAPSNGYGPHDLDLGTHRELLDVLLKVKGQVVLSGFSDPMYEMLLIGWKRVEKGQEILWIKKNML